MRSYEPSLRPPEGTHDYSWLYRTEEPAVTPPGVRSSGPELADTGSMVAPSGVAVLPGPLVSWSPSALPPTRRWRSVALLTVALGCALLLPWAAATL